MPMFHDGNRELQDAFGSRALADRLVERLRRSEFTDDDKSFIESLEFFFLATADPVGRPDCSFKGGPPGFARVIAPDLLVWPDYDGNGMFKSLGNIAVNPSVGLLFMRMGEAPKRLRVNGVATISLDDPLMADVSGRAGDDARDAGGHLPELPALHSRSAGGEAFALHPARGRAAGRAEVEGDGYVQRCRPAEEGLMNGHVYHQLMLTSAGNKFLRGAMSAGSGRTRIRSGSTSHASSGRRRRRARQRMISRWSRPIRWPGSRG